MLTLFNRQKSPEPTEPVAPHSKFLSLDEMAEIVDKFTYKPGVELIFSRGSYSMFPSLTVQYTAASSRSYSFGDVADVRITIPIIRQLTGTESEFRRWIKRMIIGAELHEMDEWLRYDGELVYDPHGTPGAHEVHFREMELEGILAYDEVLG